MKKNTIKTDRKIGNFFGVGVNSTSRPKVLTQISRNLVEAGKKDRKSAPTTVFTPNPEIVLEAKRSPEYKKILNKASYLIPDGMGLAMAYEFEGEKVSNFYPFKVLELLYKGVKTGLLFSLGKKGKLEVIKGRELFMDLIKLADKNKFKVFLLGNEKSCQKTANNIKNIYKNVSIDFAGGPKLNKKGSPLNGEEDKLQKEVIKKINEFLPSMLFVGFGAPKQEYWIEKNKNKLNTKLIMAVGGTFDFYSKISNLKEGKYSLKVFEWVFRLMREPKRLKRIVNAVIVFPIYVFLDKLREK